MTSSLYFFISILVCSHPMTANLFISLLGKKNNAFGFALLDNTVDDVVIYIALFTLEYLLISLIIFK